VNGVCIIAFIAIEDRNLGHLFQKKTSGCAISHLAACKQESERPARSVAQGMDLGRSPAA
jgi:16S rRNA C1402 N4-methylase RsmH